MEKRKKIEVEILVRKPGQPEGEKGRKEGGTMQERKPGAGERMVLESELVLEPVSFHRLSREEQQALGASLKREFFESLGYVPVKEQRLIE